MELDIVSAVKASFSWLSDSKTWKYVLLQYAFTALSILVFGGLALLVFGPVIINLFTGQSIEGLGETIISGLVAVFMLFIVWIIAVTIFSLAITVLAVNRGLELSGFRPSGGFSFGKVVKIFILEIVSFVYQIFSWYSRKLMAVVLFFYLLAFLAIATVFVMPSISIFFILLTLILALPYIAIMVYNGLRLSLAIPVMLEGDTGVTQALSKSWSMTNGHALMLLFTWIVFVIAVVAISVVATLVAGIIGTIIDIPLGTGGTIFNANFFMQQFASFITTPIITIAGYFLIVNIFAQLNSGMQTGGMGTGFRQATPFNTPQAPSVQKPRWLAEKK